MKRPLHNRNPFNLPQRGRDPFALFDRVFEKATEADSRDTKGTTWSTPAPAHSIQSPRPFRGFVFVELTLTIADDSLLIGSTREATP